MKTLFVFLHGIGDCIMFSGVLEAYKKKNPKEEIFLLVLTSGAKQIFENNPSVEGVFISSLKENPRFWNPLAYLFFDKKNIQKEINSLKKKISFDKIRIVKIQSFPEILYKIFRNYGTHKVERIAKEVHVSEKNLSYKIFSTEKEKKEAKKIIKGLSSAYAIVHPFSKDPKKNLSEEEIEKILRDLHKKKILPLIVGTEEETKRLKIKNEKIIANKSFGVLYEILRKSKEFIGTDSSIAHLAGAAKIPITIFSFRGKGKKINHGGNPSWYFPYKSKVHCIIK
jgi:ADP-heptose:LPS heptosyltransferase